MCFHCAICFIGLRGSVDIFRRTPGLGCVIVVPRGVGGRVIQWKYNLSYIFMSMVTEHYRILNLRHIPVFIYIYIYIYIYIDTACEQYFLSFIYTIFRYTYVIETPNVRKWRKSPMLYIKSKRNATPLYHTILAKNCIPFSPRLH